MRRKDRATSEKRACEIMDNAIFGTVALAAGNMPYAVPINFAREGSYLYFHCAKSGRKTEILKENSNVCISFVMSSDVNAQQLTTNYASATVEGIATLITEKDEKVQALKAICHKFAPISETTINTAIAKNLSVTAVYKVEIKSITGKESIKK